MHLVIHIMSQNLVDNLRKALNSPLRPQISQKMIDTIKQIPKTTFSQEEFLSIISTTNTSVRDSLQSLATHETFLPYFSHLFKTIMTGQIFCIFYQKLPISIFKKHAKEIDGITVERVLYYYQNYHTDLSIPVLQKAFLDGILIAQTVSSFEPTA